MAGARHPALPGYRRRGLMWPCFSPRVAGSKPGQHGRGAWQWTAAHSTGHRKRSRGGAGEGESLQATPQGPISSNQNPPPDSKQPRPRPPGDSFRAQEVLGALLDLNHNSPRGGVAGGEVQCPALARAELPSPATPPGQLCPAPSQKQVRQPPGSAHAQQPPC